MDGATDHSAIALYSGVVPPLDTPAPWDCGIDGMGAVFRHTCPTRSAPEP